MKKKALLLLQFVISAGLLLLILCNSDTEEIITKIECINFKSYLAGLMLSILFVIINAFKWSLICRLDLKNSLQLTYISQFYATILPGQIAGEAVKIVYAKKNGINLSSSSASVFIDKVTSFVAIFFLGLIGILFDNKNTVMVILFTVLIAVSILMFIFYKEVSFKTKAFLKNRNSKYIDKAIRFLDRIDEHMEKPVFLLAIILIGVICQIVGMFSHFLVLKSVGVNIHFCSLMWIFSFLSIALFIPISIGGLGVREISYVGLLGIYGISNEVALTGSLLIFTITLLNALIGGGITLGRVISDWRRA